MGGPYFRRSLNSPVFFLYTLDSDGAVAQARTATRAQFGVYTAGPFANLDMKIAGGSPYFFQIRIGDQLDIQMPADLDQYR